MNSSDSIAPDTDESQAARQVVLEALTYTGLATADVKAAILLGGVTPELLLATDELLPPPRPILLLDTLASLLELEGHASAGAVPEALAKRCTTIVLPEPAQPFCLQTYVAIWNFLIAHDLEPGSVVLSGTGHKTDNEVVRGANAAATDLLFCNSSKLLARVERGSMPAQQVADWALFIARKGSPFHALKLLYVLCGTVPRETLAPVIVDLWVAIGCPEPALDWLDALEPEQRQQCEAPLRQAAASRQQVLAETLEENRAALARHSYSMPEPRGGDRTVHIAVLPNVTWRPSPSGGALRDRYPCLFRIEGGQIVELGPPGDPRVLIEYLRKPRRQHEAVAVIGGLRSPALFQLVAELRPKSEIPDWRRKVYVVEEDPDVIFAFACTLSFEYQLSEDRFELHLGPGATERLEQRLLENLLLPMPELAVNTRRELADALARVHKHRKGRFDALIPLLAERYTPERLAALPRVLGSGGRRARVMIYTSFFTTVLKYQARDMAAAFESLGHEVLLLHEGEATQLMTTQAVLESIHDFDPDLLYCLDLIRPGLAGLPEHLPVVCWIQDELPRLSQRDWVDRIGPFDFTFCLSADWTRRYRELGYPHTAQLSMAADPNVYAPPRVHEPGATDAEPGAPPGVPAVVMITHVPRPPESIPGLFARLEPVLRAEVKMRSSLPEYDPEIRAAALALGIELVPSRLDEARLSVHLLARYVELTSVARWLVQAGLDVGLYGGGWSDIPDLASHARGVVRSGRDLSAVYSAAKLVLHINGTMNCHVRVFECLAAEGLPLCRSHAGDYEPGGLNDALRIGQEVLCFDGRQDLLDKISQLLGDEGYRQRLTRAGRRRVLDEHCMKHRMQRTLDEVRKGLSELPAQSGFRAGASEAFAAERPRVADTGY
jgi:hypothetical protein